MRTAALAQASTTRRYECRTSLTSKISPSKSCCTTRRWSATTALHVQRSAAGQDAGIGATPRATFKIAHICPALLHGVLTRMRGAEKQEENPARWWRLIQDPAYRLPRTPLTRTRVNSSGPPGGGDGGGPVDARRVARQVQWGLQERPRRASSRSRSSSPTRPPPGGAAG
jgi:hypothetical protein